MKNNKFMTFDEYLISKKDDIIMLKYRKLNDANVLALMLVETYYRKPLFRFSEYLYWVLSGDSEVSIGLSQMKVKYIKTFRNLNMIERAKYIIKLESYIENYFLIEQYISKNLNIDISDDKSICRHYNGLNVNNHYIECFKDAKLYVKSI